MEQWEAMMGGKTFITDLGEERHAEINGVDTVVGRYAVWFPIRNASRHQIVEVGPGGEIPDSRQPGVCPGVKRRQSDAG